MPERASSCTTVHLRESAMHKSAFCFPCMPRWCNSYLANQTACTAGKSILCMLSSSARTISLVSSCSVFSISSSTPLPACPQNTCTVTAQMSRLNLQSCCSECWHFSNAEPYTKFSSHCAADICTVHLLRADLGRILRPDSASSSSNAIREGSCDGQRCDFSRGLLFRDLVLSFPPRGLHPPRQGTKVYLHSTWFTVAVRRKPCPPLLVRSSAQRLIPELLNHNVAQSTSIQKLCRPSSSEPSLARSSAAKTLSHPFIACSQAAEQGPRYVSMRWPLSLVACLTCGGKHLHKKTEL